MKKGLTVLLISLIFIVVACDQLPAKQYNEDGSEAFPITFAYPYMWKIIEGSESVFLLSDSEDITKNDDGNIEGISVNSVYIQIAPNFSESPVYSGLENDKTLVSVEWLEEREAFINEREKVIQELLSNETDDSDYESTPLDQRRVYESTQIYEICDDREVVGLKTIQNITPFDEVEFGRSWDFLIILDDMPIYVLGYFGTTEISEQTYEKIFESVICSLVTARLKIEAYRDNF